MLHDAKINVYGDSILRGIGLDDGSVRYRPLEENSVKLFSEHFPVAVKNRSHFGFTVDRGMDVLEHDLEAGLDCDIALIEYGGNDCNFRWEEIAATPDQPHDPVTVLSRFEAVYKKMITELKSKNIVTVIMNLPPIDAEKYFSWITRAGLSAESILKWLGDTQMIYRFQELYSNVATRVAYETKSILVDVRSAFLSDHNYKSLLCDDGIHPSIAGQKLIYRSFARLAEQY